MKILQEGTLLSTYKFILYVRPCWEYHFRMPRNHNWASGGAFTIRPAGPTEFETQARKLRLTVEAYATSRELRTWCERNRHRCYIPEWLLLEWGLRVEPTLSE